MFNFKKEYNKNSAVDNIIDYIKEKDYGEEISTDKLSEISGIDKDDVSFFYAIAQAKKELVKSGKYIAPTYRNSYKILEPGEIAEEMWKKYIGASMQKLYNAMTVMMFTEVETMTEEEIKVFEMVQELVNKMYYANSREIQSTCDNFKKIGIKKYKQLGGL